MQVVVNPYKRYPIYTHRVCKIYLGKRRNEVNAFSLLQKRLYEPSDQSFNYLF